MLRVKFLCDYQAPSQPGPTRILGKRVANASPVPGPSFKADDVKNLPDALALSLISEGTAVLCPYSG